MTSWRTSSSEPSLAQSNGSVQVKTEGSTWRRFLSYTGPGLMISVGYMDPGNWATDLGAGAKFGYQLLYVVLLSNLMAMLLQHLALKLGLVSKRDLAQACRDHYGPVTGFILWVLCELAIIACDLAEVIGAALALQLLFDLPLVFGILLTGLDVMLVLALQHRGFRYLEVLVGSLIFLIGSCFAYELVVASPLWSEVLKGFIPTTLVMERPEALYLAIGILGATVMPHNLYLHSSIVQTRKIPTGDHSLREAIRFFTIDSSLSLFFAFFINAAILIVSAAAFHNSQYQHVADIHDAHRLLNPVLGVSLASTLFALALLASGLNATLTGTLAGQIVMEGFLNIKWKPWVRRLFTRALALVPAMIVAVYFGERGIGQLLVLSQVILSMQLSFAVVPLVLFTGDKDKMGSFANGRLLQLTAWLVAAVIAALNVYLLYQSVVAWF
jgi:manganese transport protein